MDEPFPDPNTEIVYLRRGDLIYLGDGRISIRELPDDERGYSLHTFLQDKPLIMKRNLTNAYIFDLGDKSLTPIFPEGDISNRILAYQGGLIYTWNLLENRGYLHDYRGNVPTVTPVEYPPGYEGKYTTILFPIGGEGEILYIDNLNHTLHYKGRDLEMPSYESFYDVYYLWKPPYLFVGTEYILFGYRLDLEEDKDMLVDYALPPLRHVPGYINGNDERGFFIATIDYDETYIPEIIDGMLDLVPAPGIVDGNDPYTHPDIPPAMEAFLWTIDAEPIIVYTYRKLREMIANNPTLSPSIAGLIAKYL